MSERTYKILFFVFLLWALFVNLGERPFFGVEGRWAEAAREMTLRGSWFVPTLNFEPHITKPLIPFWLIKISSELLRYSEFSVRLPGAILALLSVFFFYLLSRKLFDERASLLAISLYGVSLGFLQFARLAQSEIYQLFGIVTALAIYLHFRDKPFLRGYLLFVLAMVFSALCKGLTAFAVLGLFVALDFFLYKRVYHFNFKLLLALALGVILYFLPYYLTAKALNSELPFFLWFRENLKQAVDPYDNLRPFYIYFFYLPVWVLPFSLFLFAFLYKGIKTFKSLSLDEKLFILSNLSIFLLFTFAKARRGYYILPILPFAVISMTYFIKENFSHLLTKIYQYLAFFLPPLHLLLIFLLPSLGFKLTPKIYLPLLALTLFQVFFLYRFRHLSSPFEKFLTLVLLFLLSETLFFAHLQPALSKSTEKEAGLFLKRLSTLNPSLRICSFSKRGEPVANVYFYAEIKEKVRSYEGLDEALRDCKVILARALTKEDLNLIKEKGLTLFSFEHKKDKSKSYYIFYNSTTLKTPSF